jgi:hypothetical protein
METGVTGVPCPPAVPPAVRGLNLPPGSAITRHLPMEEQTARDPTLKLNLALCSYVVVNPIINDKQKQFCKQRPNKRQCYLLVNLTPSEVHFE